MTAWGTLADLTLQVAELRYEYGLSIEDVAAETSMTRSGVHYHLARHARGTLLPDPRPAGQVLA